MSNAGDAKKANAKQVRVFTQGELEAAILRERRRWIDALSRRGQCVTVGHEPCCDETCGHCAALRALMPGQSREPRS